MTEIPHLAFPIRFIGDDVLTVEQDTIEEIELCVRTILAWRIGERPEAPEFGIPDPTFGQAPIDLEPIRAAVLDFEPRARLLLEQAQGAGVNQLDTIILATLGGPNVG